MYSKVTEQRMSAERSLSRTAEHKAPASLFVSLIICFHYRESHLILTTSGEGVGSPYFHFTEEITKEQNCPSDLPKVEVRT